MNELKAIIEAVYKCPICGQKFDSQDDYDWHYGMTHNLSGVYDKIGKYYAKYNDDKTEIIAVTHVISLTRYSPEDYECNTAFADGAHNPFWIGQYIKIGPKLGEEISEGKAKDFAVKCIKNYIERTTKREYECMNEFLGKKLSQSLLKQQRLKAQDMGHIYLTYLMEPLLIF